MKYFFILALRILAFICGLLCVYVALFLYEDEQGKLQNILENSWVKIGKLKKHATTLHVAFMNYIAGLMTSGFNRLFGKNPFSKQLLGVSICYGFALLNITLLVISIKFTNQPDYGSIGPIMLGITYGSIPVIIKKKSWMNVWFYLLIIFVSYEFVIPWLYASMIVGTRKPNVALFPWTILIGIGFGLIVFTIFIVLLLQSVRYISTSKSMLKIGLICLLNTIPPFALYGLLRSLFLILHDPKEIPVPAQVDFQMFSLMAVSCAIIINIAFLLSAIIFTVFAVVMLGHRLFWPILQRPTYALKGLGVAQRSKILFSLGLILIGIAMGVLPEWAKILVDKLHPG